MDNPGSPKFQKYSIVTLHMAPNEHTSHVHEETLFRYSFVFEAPFSGAC